MSLAIAATTMVSALAYDLSDYPAPFVEDGVFNGAIVVGATAATQDVLGAIDIAASLQAESKSGTEVAGASTVAVEGGEDFNLAPNTGAYAGATFDDGDLEGFADSDVELEDTDYDYHEEVVIGAAGLDILTSVETTYADDDDYGLDAWMELYDDGLTYRIVFDDEIPAADFGTATDNQELEIDFLGKSIVIADVTAGSDEITVESSAEFFMQEGDKVTVEGHEIELKRVGTTSALVSVDGQTLAITDGESEEFDEADDFEVEVDNLFYIENADDNSATLKLGTAISKTYGHGDALEIFDGEDDADEATWKWHIVEDGANLEEIGVTLNIDHERNNDDDDPEKRAGLMFGEELSFPNNYAAVSFAGWKESEMANYDTLSFEFDIVDLDVNVDRPVLEITSSADDPFVMDDAADASVVWLDLNGNFWYEDGDDEVDSGAATMDLVFDADTIAFSYGAGDDTINITFPGGDVINLSTDAAFTYFGDDEGDADVSDFLYTDANGGTIAATDDEDYLTSYGVKISDIESQFDDDEFTLEIPHDGLVAELVVKSSGTVVSAGASGSTSYSVNPIGLGLGILDTDAPALGSKPMIVVGGPYANTVAAELLGNPTPEQIGETFTDGKALISWYEDQQAMLVAGWSAQDTQGASYVVAKYDQYDLTGDEVEVVVTSLDNIKVNAVN